LADQRELRFNINVFTGGILLAVLLSALGFSERDATLQWIVPGTVLVTATVAALFWPPRKRARKAPPV